MKMCTQALFTRSMREWYARVVTIIFSLLITGGFLSVSLFGNSPVVHAATMPGGDVTDATVRGVDLASPAVVRIITSLNAQIAVQVSSKINVTFPQGNGTGYQVQVSGTGTFVSANGDILTADHVVNPPHDQELNSLIYQSSAPDIASYMAQHAAKGTTPPTADQVDQELVNNQLRSTITYSTPSSTAFLSTAYTGSLSAPDFNSLPTNIFALVDRIEMQSSPNQRDVAIVHVPMTDTLSVQLGDASNVQQQDDLSIIGFPGNADVSQRPNDFLTSSINQVYVSSIKTSDSGAPLIQVGGNVEQGDSGGPALDKNGTIVGIVSFAVANPGSSGTNGTSFLQSGSSAQDMISSLHLNTKPGVQQQLWNQAFSDYVSATPGHWKKAQQDFAQLSTKYPLFKGVSTYVSYVQAQAKNEKPVGTSQGTKKSVNSQKSGGFPIPLQTLIVVIAVVFLLLVILLVLFGVRARRRKKQQAQGNPIFSGGPVSPASSAGNSSFAQNPARQVGIQQQQRVPGPPSIAAGAIIPHDITQEKTFVMKTWPCGHSNRPNARFCTICGEPAP